MEIEKRYDPSQERAKVFEDLIAQIEAVSKGYADKHNIRRDADWFILKLQEEVGELTQAYLKATHRGRTHGASTQNLRQKLNEEVADVFSHLMLFAYHNDIDIITAVEKKWLAWLPSADQA